MGLAAGLALLFDMDGVLVDSNPLHREAWTAFNRGYGIETTEEMQQQMYGKRNDDIVRAFYGDHLPAEEVRERGAAKERLYRRMMDGRIEQMLVPGIRDFLERYRDAPMALASNAEPLNVNFVLDQSGLRRYFRVVVDGHQVAHPKPFPDVYLRAAEGLGAVPANCIVFEDSNSGVEAARRAGMRVIGICTTHDNLRATDLNIDNFWNGSVTEWLAAQSRVL